MANRHLNITHRRIGRKRDGFPIYLTRGVNRLQVSRGTKLVGCVYGHRFWGLFERRGIHLDICNQYVDVNNVNKFSEKLLLVEILVIFVELIRDIRDRFYIWDTRMGRRRISTGLLIHKNVVVSVESVNLIQLYN